MSTSYISCLLLLCTLTLSVGRAFTVSKSKTNSKHDVFLTFPFLGKLGDPEVHNEEIVEEIKELNATSIYFLHMEQIPSWAQFIVFQTHVHLHNVTLGYGLKKEKNKYVNGQNIGLVQNVSATGAAQFFLQNENSFNVSVMIAVVAYSKNEPMPGGCNMEFGVEIAPWLEVNVTGPMVIVTSQPARPARVAGLGDVCDMPSLHYQAYHRYLPESDFTKDTYFANLRQMLTVSRVLQNGRKVRDTTAGQMKHSYSAYHGTGTVYTVVVTDEAQSMSALYIPALRYSCNPAFYVDSCQNLPTIFSKLLSAAVAFIGLFICAVGHSFFQTELFLFTTLMGSIFFYVLVSPLALNDATNVMLATVGGVTVGNFWLVLWWASGSPMLSIVMATFTVGFLATSTAFHAGLADLTPMESNANFWMAFLCGVLVVAMLIGPQTSRVNLIACAVVGSYATIVTIDHYIGSSLKYIYINTLRRATVDGFNQAIIDPPFQIKDWVLTVVWLVLAVAGYIYQAQRFVGRPMFPHHEHHWSHLLHPHLYTSPPMAPPQRHGRSSAPAQLYPALREEERTPLLYPLPTAPASKPYSVSRA